MATPVYAQSLISQDVWQVHTDNCSFPARQIAFKNRSGTQRHRSSSKTQCQKRDLFCISGVLRIYRFILHRLLVEISPKNGWVLLCPTVITSPTPPPPPITKQHNRT